VSRALLTLIASMTPLADWYATHKPTCKVITLARSDFDLVQKNDGVAGITINNGIPYWRGFELRPQGESKKSEAARP
jgi:hypothetical protein